MNEGKKEIRLSLGLCLSLVTASACGNPFSDPLFLLPSLSLSFLPPSRTYQKHRVKKHIEGLSSSLPSLFPLIPTSRRRAHKVKREGLTRGV